MKFFTCRRIVAAWSETLDRPASLSRRFTVWVHCLICRPCRRYIEQALTVREAARRTLNEPEEPSIPDAALTPDVRARIRKAAEDAAR